MTKVFENGISAREVVVMAADGNQQAPLAETPFTGHLGEVQATPTANTVLGRLKAAVDYLATLAGAVLGTNVKVVTPVISTATTPAGQITVTTAGTAVQGPNVALTNGVWIRALSTNAGVCWIGNTSGDVDNTNGFEMPAGNLISIQIANLNELWFDAAGNGYKLTWLKG